MKTVILQNNIILGEKIQVDVTDTHYKKLKYLEKCGGFLRFNMELYDDRKGPGKSDLEKLLPFLHTVFANKPLINSYFGKRTK